MRLKMNYTTKYLILVVVRGVAFSAALLYIAHSLGVLKAGHFLHLFIATLAVFITLDILPWIISTIRGQSIISDAAYKGKEIVWPTFVVSIIMILIVYFKRVLVD